MRKPNNCFLFLVNYFATEYQIYVSETNVALWRPTFQSGARNGRGSSLAVDGHTDPGICSSTSPVKNPWWAVDMGATFKLKSVEVSQCDEKKYSKWTKYVY